MCPRRSEIDMKGKRVLALVLLEEGRTLREVAKDVGCAVSSVMRWRKRWKQRGSRGLEVRASPGRPPKLSHDQRQQLARLLRKGPRACGYRIETWTRTTVGALIEKVFKVHYHVDHIGRVLHKLNKTWPKVARRVIPPAPAATLRSPRHRGQNPERGRSRHARD
jgi:transposase